MQTPGSRALRPALHEGTVLAGRYRLVVAQPPAATDPAQASRWLAEDDVLARPVDVLALVATGRRAAWGRELLEAAAAAGTVGHPVLASVYDAALEEVAAERYGRPAGTVDVAYVVSEHLAGPTLGQQLQDDGPLEPGDALERVLVAADGLAAVHGRGVVHGGIGPASVVLSGDGGMRLRDAAVAPVLQRLPDRDSAAADPRQDVRDLTACLYALLTGRWPATAVGRSAAGLPDAPDGRDGRLCRPRQVRAGVPGALDDAVVRVLDPQPGAEVTTAEALSAALRRARAVDTAAMPGVPRRRLPRPPAALLRVLPVLLVAAVVVAVGLTAHARGRALGTVRRDTSDLEQLVESTPSPVPGGAAGATAQRLALTAPGVVVRAFDPPPGDGREDDGAVGNAVDADPATAWTTEGYDTPQVGGIKPGVGLLVDLGTPTPVQQVELGMTPGADVELHAADAAGADIGAFPLVASVTGAPAVTRLVPAQPVTARYFVVWLTKLPPDGGRFRGSISEMFFVHA